MFCRSCGTTLLQPWPLHMHYHGQHMYHHSIAHAILFFAESNHPTTTYYESLIQIFYTFLQLLNLRGALAQQQRCFLGNQQVTRLRRRNNFICINARETLHTLYTIFLSSYCSSFRTLGTHWVSLFLGWILHLIFLKEIKIMMA